MVPIFKHMRPPSWIALGCLLLLSASNLLRGEEPITVTSIVAPDLVGLLDESTAQRVHQRRILDYPIPQLKSEDFEILSIEFKFSTSMYVDSWQLPLNEFWEAGAYVNLKVGTIGSETEYLDHSATDVFDGGIGVGVGVSTVVHHGALRLWEFVGDGSKVIRLWMDGAASVHPRSPNPKGSFYFLLYEPATVTYKLRRINPAAALPPYLVGLGMRVENMRADFSEIERLPPDFAEDMGRDFPGLSPAPKCSWTFPAPKRFQGSLFAFPGYRYRLMRGSVPGTGVVVQSLDGAGGMLSFEHDDGAASDQKAFFWIDETKIPD